MLSLSAYNTKPFPLTANHPLSISSLDPADPLRPQQPVWSTLLGRSVGGQGGGLIIRSMWGKVALCCDEFPSRLLFLSGKRRIPPRTEKIEKKKKSGSGNSYGTGEDLAKE